MKEEKARKALRGTIAPWIIFGIILCVGIFVIIYGAKPELFRDESFVSTNATVIGYEERYVRSSGATHYFPMYDYEYNGVEYIITSDTSVSPVPFEVGEEITIYVNPADPTDIVTPIGDKFFIIFGSVVLVLSIFALGLSTYHFFDEIFPRADWPKYVFRNIPILLFLWFGTILVGVTGLKSPSNGVTAGFVGTVILFILLCAFSIFITVIMAMEAIEELRY